MPTLIRLKITSLLDNKVTRPTDVVLPENSKMRGKEWPNKSPDIELIPFNSSFRFLVLIFSFSGEITFPSCVMILFASSVTVMPLIIGIATRPSEISIAC